MHPWSQQPFQIEYRRRYIPPTEPIGSIYNIRRKGFYISITVAGRGGGEGKDQDTAGEQSNGIANSIIILLYDKNRSITNVLFWSCASFIVLNPSWFKNKQIFANFSLSTRVSAFISLALVVVLVVQNNKNSHIKIDSNYFRSTAYYKWYQIISTLLT